ncbi:Nramp family divalent metal transporter [Sphingomonas sp. HITSZ_GF]|uniref:Nramp family divalent metal transporter n=1 Tax=Sphingomonas sp. HITSZ_GF TaxID=3037247 RepID=UPI00240D68B5|nr:Nramp family divalent metal transporter [Sphingomonas sp. HITSZ_GF]MDG2534738.1 Nramp family divalent metal transporter [Sphingomonas sp. HITSZ_GF]
MTESRKEKTSVAKQLGPGLITGAADDDPSGIATYSQAGAQFGYGLMWTMVLTYPLMSAVQLVSAHIGRVTGQGLAHNMRELLPNWLLTLLVTVLFLANTINIGADIAAMGDAAQLVAGWGDHWFTIVFALFSLLLQAFVPYHRYARVLKWLTLSLFAYVAVVLVVQVDWAAAGRGLVVPSLSGPQAIATVVAIFGTTISPYLFFWQTAQEVEEIEDDDEAKPLTEAPEQAPREIRRMRIDTFVGMAFSNLIALAIMVAAAATLHVQGVTEINTAADAAEALKPVAGDFAFALFAIGIIGTGLLAVPVLAGSAGFAVSNARGWRCGLEHKVAEAPGFYGVIALAILLGIVLDWSGIPPMQALFWSAVVNGFAAVPIMAVMMIIATRRQVMGEFRIRGPLLLFGWAATLVMGAAAVAMLVWR